MTYLRTTLYVADLEEWHSLPDYSPVVAQALTDSYSLLRNGHRNLADIMRAYNIAREVVEMTMHVAQRRNVNTVLATAAGETGRWHEALYHYGMALSLADSLQDRAAQIELRYLRALTQANRACFSQAAEDAMVAIELLHEETAEGLPPDAAFEMELLTRLAVYVLYLERFDMVEECLSEARALASLAQDLGRSAARADYVYALLAQARGQASAGLPAALSAAKVFLEHDHGRIAAHVQAMMAEVVLDAAEQMPAGADRKHFLRMATEHCTLARKLAREARHDVNAKHALLVMLRCERLKGSKRDRSARLFAVARFASEVDDIALMAHAFTTLADELAHQGQYAAAIARYRLVLRLVRDHGAPFLAFRARKRLLQLEEAYVPDDVQRG